MKMEALECLNKKVVDLCKGKRSEENRMGLKETIIEMHGMLKTAKDLNEYSAIETLYGASRELLRHHYQDYVTLEHVSIP